jgi:hypothetical protein
LPFISDCWGFRLSSGTVQRQTIAQAKRSFATIAPSKHFDADGANYPHLHPNLAQGFGHRPESGLMPPLGSRLAMMLVREPISGQPKSYQGSGACAGNVSIALNLSSLYPGLTLHYNSTWNTNRLGLGANISLSDIAFASPNGAWIQLGDGYSGPRCLDSSAPVVS